MKTAGKLFAVVILLGVIAGGVLYLLVFGEQTGSDASTSESDTQSITTTENLSDSSESAVAEVRSDISALTPDMENQTEIIFSENGITVNGSGASVSGSVVTISDSGTYAVSGSMEDGQIYVDAGGSDEVILLLNGLTLGNEEEPAIYVENAGQTQLYMAEGTVNTIASGTAVEIGAQTEDSDEDLSGGAIYARDDLSISGEGTLIVYGYLNNGIQTTNHLLIDSGTIQVTAVNNGIKGKDSVTITGGTFTVVAGGDGIKSNDTTGENYGIVTISGGTFDIEAYGDGVQAETALAITGGSFEIVSGGGSSEATYSSSENWRVYGSNWDRSDETDVSAKGLKGGTQVTITGGSFTIDSCDDAVHSNGDIVISGGSFEIASGDDGMHGDTSLTINGGTIVITDSYEGLEANQITISGGDITLTAYDDGLNANGGTSSAGGFGRSTSTSSSSGTDMPTLRITDGNLVVNAGGDGLDSNGDIIIEGGVTIVNGPTDSQNGAIDSGTESGGTCTISGGTVLALGSSGMAETFSSSSEQCSFMCSMSTFSSGDALTITDADGTVIYQYTVTKSGSSVVFSSPELKQGETYTLTVGSQSAEITLSSTSTTTSGSSGMGGGMGGQSGMGGRGAQSTVPGSGETDSSLNQPDGSIDGSMGDQSDMGGGNKGGMGGSR
ncbi:MAG: carbohydrate-binding domain-containing protein [Lachnospiraceae bacterium]|nr:carbohydrate-binding domain-containing protein [Lachnospiraceae bacterium]